MTDFLTKSQQLKGGNYVCQKNVIIDTVYLL